jgi:hypothetical protein
MASKDSNSMVISLAVFVLLSVMLGIGLYMTWAHSDTLATQLAASQKGESDAKAAVTNLNENIRKLTALIGRGEGTEPSAAMDDLVTESQTEIAKRSPGATPPANLEAAASKFASDRDASSFAAADRQNQLNAKTQQLVAEIEAHKAAMASMKTSLDAKDAELLANQRQHEEQLGQREAQITSLEAEKRQLQEAAAALRAQTDRVIEEQEKELARQRESLRDLRRERDRLQGISYERPDGTLTFVDQGQLTCYVDLGRLDELRIGTTFSVYRKNNSGVGRAQSDKDIKGKIEIVDLLGDHLAEARIVDQKREDPMAEGDPIYSPVFFPGQKLQIAVVGGLEFDGNPGSDRDEFKRLVSVGGAEVVLEANDDAKLVDRSGNEVSISDIPNLITAQTRFLVVGDLGDEDTEDAAQAAINTKLRELHVEMRDAAENSGVRLIDLASFLDYMGYSRKRLVWTQTSPFPGKLPNGSKSLAVTTGETSQVSSRPDDGSYPSAKRKPLVSTGSTSALYRSNAGND